MRQLCIILGIILVFSQTSALSTLPLPFSNDGQTSKPVIQKSTSSKISSMLQPINPFNSFLEFIKRILKAIYQENLKNIVDIALCVIERVKEARVILYLAINRLIHFDFSTFIKYLHNFLQFVLQSPFC